MEDTTRIIKTLGLLIKLSNDSAEVINALSDRITNLEKKNTKANNRSRLAIELAICLGFSNYILWQRMKGIDKTIGKLSKEIKEIRDREEK